MILGCVVSLAAIALAALLAAPWYETTVHFATETSSAEADASQAFSAFDILILVGAAGTLIAYLLGEFRTAIATAAVILIAIVYRLIDPPVDEVMDYTVDLAWGAWTAAAVAIVLLAACVVAERQSVKSLARPGPRSEAGGAERSTGI